MKRRLLPLLGAAFLLVILVAIRYPSHSSFPVRGLDISHHQGVIAWQKVPVETVDFVYIKASEGGDFRDRQFVYNWQGAQKRGIARGAYHFFTFCKSGREQAINFISTVGDLPGELPPMVDVEYGGNCRKRLTEAELAQELEDFEKEVQKAWGLSPVVYVTRDMYAVYPQLFQQKNLWVRAIMQPPGRYYDTSWTLWQYCHFGRVQGIEGPVDLNVFQGSNEEFQLWRSGREE